MFVYEEQVGILNILDHFLDSNIERCYNILEQAGYRIIESILQLSLLNPSTDLIKVDLLPCHQCLLKVCANLNSFDCVRQLEG